MTDAALFDWDGTLLDSREVLLRAWHTASQQIVGRRFPADAAEEELVFTMPGKQLFPHVAGALHPALNAAFQRAYGEVASSVRAFAGVHDALSALRAEGVGIAIVTSKSRVRFEHDAEAAGLAALIDVAVCMEDTGEHKPSPVPVLRALELLGAAPHASVMTGDTPVDIAAGAAAGTRTVGVAWGASGSGPLAEAGADAVARDMVQLVGLVLERHEHEERVTS
jgi:pyrophosphatase PpaX